MSMGVGKPPVSLSLTRKNSSSGAQRYENPSLLALPIALSKMYLGSPSKRLFCGVNMSQMSLHDDFSFGRQGSTAKVVGSGYRTMSDSSIGRYPVMDEPSKG